MKIKIKETKEITELSIIDPKTGTDWAADLLGNYDADMFYDNTFGVVMMRQEEYNWWKGLIERLQAAEDRKEYIYKNTDEPEAFLEHMEFMVSNDLEGVPEAINDLLDDWENK